MLVCKAFDSSFMALGFLHVQFPPWELALSWTYAVLDLHLAGAKLRLFQFSSVQFSRSVMSDSLRKFGKLSSDHGTGKGQFPFQFQRKAMPKNVQTTTQLRSFHMLASLCSKSFKTGFSGT